VLKELGNVAAIVYIFQLYSVGEGVLKYTFYYIYIYKHIKIWGRIIMCIYFAYNSIISVFAVG